MSEIAVIGAGAWGTAISIVLGRKQTHRVRLWAHESEVCESVRTRHVNELFLPGHTIPETVQATNSLEEALCGAEIVVSVMPSHHTRRVFEAMLPQLRPEMLYVSATKGIENDSLLRMTEVITQLLSGGRGGFVPRIGAMSGPNVRQGSCERRSHRYHDCFIRQGTDGHRATGVQRSQFSGVYE